MFIAYVSGPPVAIFAGSRNCTKSFVDGVAIALGEPIGDCENIEEIKTLMSIATTVHELKKRGIRVYVSRSQLGPDGVMAAYAGGADGVVEELATDKIAIIDARSLGELMNKYRELGELRGETLDVFVRGDLETLIKLGAYADGAIPTAGFLEIGVGPCEKLPEIGRCTNCNIDFLMYNKIINKCIYCGRRLKRLYTDRSLPQNPIIFKKIYKKYSLNINYIKLKLI